VPYGEGQHLLLVRDVSRQMRLENMRKDFVANASHELRSPLSVITGYLETLHLKGEQLSPEEQRNYLGVALKQTEQLSGLWRLAELAHPDKPLSRGFARVTSRDGKTLTHARDARATERLTLQFADGAVNASVDEGGPARPVERKARKPYIPPQRGLFDPAED